MEDFETQPNPTQPNAQTHPALSNPRTPQRPSRLETHLPNPLSSPNQTGTSNAAFWETPDSAAFERTPLGVNEYRQEGFSPPYLFRPNRPRAAAPAPPAWVPYGGSFRMGYAFPDAPGGWRLWGLGLLGRGGA